MTILVTGATGPIGRNLVEVLTTEGVRVRATSRKPQEAALSTGVEVVPTDAPGAEMFDGVDRMFVFPFENGVDDLMTAAVAAGVQRFVVLSSLAAAGELPREVASSSYRHHLAIERSVTSRTDNWTILRPGTFAGNLLSWAWPIRSGGPVRAPYIQSAQPPIHEADIADAAAVTLTQDGHRARIYPLTGPQSLTRIEQVAAISAAIGREIELQEITPDEFRAETARYIPEDIISMLLAYWSETVTTPDPVRPGFAALTGHPGRTLHQWAQDHRTAFTAA
ncbi:NAD(P)H-binding protein [Actinoplanes sp. NPDC051494]|uniref:NmrA family NAD(P)-binding protein n=1 Tax=Actinoplanes sp. NPDC051494 TaxID=3363907 RepID=UPI0037BB291F